jgi:hypothetical protein
MPIDPKHPAWKEASPAVRRELLEFLATREESASASVAPAQEPPARPKAKPVGPAKPASPPASHDTATRAPAYRNPVIEAVRDAARKPRQTIGAAPVRETLSAAGPPSLRATTVEDTAGQAGSAFSAGLSEGLNFPFNENHEGDVYYAQQASHPFFKAGQAIGLPGGLAMNLLGLNEAKAAGAAGKAIEAAGPARPATTAAPKGLAELTPSRVAPAPGYARPAAHITLGQEPPAPRNIGEAHLQSLRATERQRARVSRVTAGSQTGSDLGPMASKGRGASKTSDLPPPGQTVPMKASHASFKELLADSLANRK